MTYTSFSGIFSSPHASGLLSRAYEKEYISSIGSDSKSGNGNKFEGFLAEEIRNLGLDTKCFTNGELDKSFDQGYIIDCSNFGSPDWKHLKNAIKDLFHPISAADIYLTTSDPTSGSIKIIDGLSVKTCKSDRLMLNNDAEGQSWDVVKSMENNQADSRSTQKLKNILIVKANSDTGRVSSFLFEGSIQELCDSFEDLTCEQMNRDFLLYHCSNKKKCQAVVFINRNVNRRTKKGKPKKPTSWDRGIQLNLTDEVCAALTKNNFLQSIAQFRIDFKKIDKDYTEEIHGFPPPTPPFRT